jgi:hypothetical protein
LDIKLKEDLYLLFKSKRIVDIFSKYLQEETLLRRCPQEVNHNGGNLNPAKNDKKDKNI